MRDFDGAQGADIYIDTEKYTHLYFSLKGNPKLLSVLTLCIKDQHAEYF